MQGPIYWIFPLFLIRENTSNQFNDFVQKCFFFNCQFLQTGEIIFKISWKDSMNFFWQDTFHCPRSITYLSSNQSDSGSGWPVNAIWTSLKQIHQQSSNHFATLLLLLGLPYKSWVGIGRVTVGAVYESSMPIKSYIESGPLSRPITPIPDCFLYFSCRSS